MSICFFVFAPMTSMPLVPTMPSSGMDTVYGAVAGRPMPGSVPVTSIPQYSGCLM
jgi:hypothetical protein